MNHKESQKQILIENLKESGLKLTPQRQAIYFDIIEDKSHPTAQTVYNRIKINYPYISFDTVNRTLLSFVEKGLAVVIPDQSKAKRFDACIDPHCHFSCLKCHRLIDVDYDFSNKINIPKSINKNKIMQTKIIFEGICDDCK